MRQLELYYDDLQLGLGQSTARASLAPGWKGADAPVPRPLRAVEIELLDDVALSASPYAKDCSMRQWRPLNRSFRSYSTQVYGTLGQLVSNSHFTHHVYLSRSHDPFLNLATEQYLLENSHKDSTVLFLYTNSPCVVIGRNQNPWLEVNLRLLKHNPGSSGRHGQEEDGSGPGVQLVRRRSGGGTVFHDEGNVNYSVICPPAKFTRDKHAEMVTRAMRRFNPRARVNERHDIVLDQGVQGGNETAIDCDDTHRTVYASNSKTPLKVSGSAYKVTTKRSLHHGTCLLASPNLGLISKLLRSPAKGFLSAKGVESVRSPVGNVFHNAPRKLQRVFQVEIVKEFANMYDITHDAMALFNEDKGTTSILQHGKCCYGQLEPAAMPDIETEVVRIKSPTWVFGETPQFTLSSHSTDDAEGSPPQLPKWWPSSARVLLKSKKGVITSVNMSTSPDQQTSSAQEQHFKGMLKYRVIHEIHDFNDLLTNPVDEGGHEEITAVASWLNSMLGKRLTMQT